MMFDSIEKAQYIHDGECSYGPPFLTDAKAVTRKLFICISLAVFPLTFFVDAPFGRFTPNNTAWTLDGRKAWIAMEVASPIMFTYTFLSSPLSGGTLEPTLPQFVLAGLFLIHYTNRTFISPLRTPSRSRSHIIVPLNAFFLNIINGSLLGSYLSSPDAHSYLEPSQTLTSPRFYVGVTLWFLGFVGNIVHDEILSNIRRKASLKGKTQAGKEYYAIPHGLLFNYVSFPNYLCEWIEWLGFGLAAAPLPVTALSELSPSHIMRLLAAPAPSISLTAPYIFVLVEILFMFPRAYRSQQWYKKTFGDAFPKDRKIVIPFLL